MSHDTKILIIEDDLSLSGLIKQCLEEEDYVIDSASNGEEGEQLIEDNQYALLVVDIGLPGKDGIEVCRTLRCNNNMTPVLIVTGIRKTETDVMLGLNCGADDYLIKPFSPGVLLARVKALLRRGLASNAEIQLGDLVLDPRNLQIKLNNKSLLLTPKEYAILEHLIRHRDELVSRISLEKSVWENGLQSSSNLVDVNMKRLRDKLEQNSSVITIETIRGLGYRLIGWSC